METACFIDIKSIYLFFDSKACFLIYKNIMTKKDRVINAAIFP